MQTGRALFQLGYQLSPIIFTGGIAASIPGNMLPIIAITQSLGLVNGLLSGDLDLNPDHYFAHFRPLPGASLVNNQIGEYPFANQTIAANAVIAAPLHVSIEMSCPANTPGGYISKLLTMTAIKQAFATHNSTGGTYTVATPSYIYTNCIMKRMIDRGNEGTQVQTKWIMDFEQPLIALADADTLYNSLMDRIAKGLPQADTPTWSGLASTVGSKVSNAASSVVSSAKNLVGIASQ